MFEVRRVWKGRVARHTVVYNFYRKDNISEGRRALKTGPTTYLVIAHVQSEAERVAFGLPADGEATLGTANCLAGTLVAQAGAILHQRR